MATSLLFGGKDLSQYIKITDIKRPLIANRSNYSVDIPSLNGEVYMGHKYGTKEIEISFAMICKTNEQYFEFMRELGTMLDTTVPTKLVLGDEPTKYYYAVVDGSTEVDKIFTTGIGTIKFLCHNPVAYSDSQSIFEGDEDGKVTIVNNGSAKTQPLINVQFSQEAQFLQATNYTGEVILIGQRTKADNPTIEPDPSALVDPCDTTAEWLSTGNVLDSGREVMGNCTINTGGYGICCSNYGSSDLGWHGGALRRNLKMPVEEFEVGISIEHDSQGSVKGQGSNPTTPPNNGGVYKCNATPSLRIRDGRSTDYKKVGSIPKGKEVTVTDISGGWGKVTYGGVTGYSSMDYLSFIRNNTKSVVAPQEGTTDPSAENRMGMIEVYGFDTNGQKMFKFVMKDSDEWYEYTEPEVYIGSKLVLSDGVNAPKPKTKTETDSEGKQTISNTDGGKFGKWNEFNGSFYLKRVKDGSGGYQWYTQVTKYVNGMPSETLKSNTISDASFPKGALGHIVIYFGQWKDKVAVDTMNVKDVNIYSLTKLPSTPVNKKIFKKGDEVIIDCENNKVYKNKELYMTDLDIGSSFFSVGKGTSQFMVLSDDKKIDVEASITEKWL